MSYWTTIQTEMVSLEHLLKALRDVGLHVVQVYDDAQPFYPWAEDAQETLSEVIIRPQYLFVDSSPMGFKRGEDGRFKAVISRGDRKRLNEEWIKRLTERYNHHKAADSPRKHEPGTMSGSVGAGKAPEQQFGLKRAHVKLESKWRLGKYRDWKPSRPKKFIHLEPEPYTPEADGE
ncbi:MAG: DUF1257 domain-containing protein [Deltaproteobacteria bacterium]|nr:DUF1257 domain-containing protein [Deltaproteobacteria bacterium]